MHRFYFLDLDIFAYFLQIVLLLKKINAVYKWQRQSNHLNMELSDLQRGSSHSDQSGVICITKTDKLINQYTLLPICFFLQQFTTCRPHGLTTRPSGKYLRSKITKTRSWTPSPPSYIHRTPPPPSGKNPSVCVCVCVEL